jgi:hypothetical protein
MALSCFGIYSWMWISAIRRIGINVFLYTVDDLGKIVREGTAMQQAAVAPLRVVRALAALAAFLCRRARGCRF